MQEIGEKQKSNEPISKSASQCGRRERGEDSLEWSEGWPCLPRAENRGFKIADSEKQYSDLEDALAKEHRWSELLAICEEHVHFFPDSSVVSALLTYCGNVAITHLGNADKAKEFYQRAMIAQKSNWDAWRGLQKLYELREDLSGVAYYLERQAMQMPSEGKCLVYLDLGGIYRRVGKIPEASIAYYRAIRCKPDCRQAYDGLLFCLFGLERWSRGLALIEEIEAKFGGSGLDSFYLEISKNVQRIPSEFSTAIRATRGALRVNPQNKAAEILLHEFNNNSQIVKKQGKLEFSWLINSKTNRKQLSEIVMFALGCTSENRADSKNEAQDYLLGILRICPGFLPALDALEKIGEDSGELGELIPVYEELASKTHDRQARAEVKLRQAKLQINCWGDESSALEILLPAARLDPANKEIVGMGLELLLQKSNFSQAADLLERFRVRLQDRWEGVNILIFLADLYAKELGETRKAQKSLEEALQIDPCCEDAIRRLVSLYEKSGDAHKLVGVLEREISFLSTTDPAERAVKIAKLQKISQIYADRLERWGESVRALSRALILNPMLEDIRKNIEKHAAQGALWKEVVRIYDVAAQSTSVEGAIPLVRRAAQILDALLGDVQESLLRWKRLLLLQPEDAQAISAIEMLSVRVGQRDEQIQEIKQKLKQSSDTSEQGLEKRYLLWQMASGLEQQGSDPWTARVLYRQMLEIDPDDVGVIKRFGAACAAIEKWEEVAEVTARMACLASHSEEKVEWRSRWAQVLNERLGRKEEAADIYLELIQQNPRPEFYVALERIAAYGVATKRIAEVCFPFLLESGDFGRAVQALELLIYGTDDVRKRIHYMEKMSSILQEKFANSQSAWDWLEMAFRLDPSDHKIREQLEQLSAELSYFERISLLFIEVARGVESSLALELLLRASQLARAGNETDLAIQAFENALEYPDCCADVAHSLYDLAQQTDNLVVCEKALRILIEKETKDKTPLWISLSKTLERQERWAEAAASIENALALGENIELLVYLAELYEKAKDSAGQESALTRELQFAEKAKDTQWVHRVRSQLSKLLGNYPNDRLQAIAHCSAILAEKPGDIEAISSLEKMLQVYEIRQAAAQALVPIYESSKEYRKLIHALEILIETSEEASQKVALLRKEAQVHAHNLRNPSLAFETLVRAFYLAPTDAQLRMTTRKAAEEAGSQFDVYAKVLAKVGELVQGPPAIPILRELSEICEKKIGKPKEAISCLYQILEIDTDSIDGLRGLYRLLHQEKNWEELADICQKLTQVVYEDQERAELLQEAGNLWEFKLGKLEKAAECWRMLWESDVKDLRVLQALERLYEKLGWEKELASVWEFRIQLEGNTPSGREAAFNLAELKRGTLQDQQAALALYDFVLSGDAEHNGVLVSLEEWALAGDQGSLDAAKRIEPYLERLGKHQTRIAWRESILGKVGGGQAAQLTLEICNIYESSLGRPELAFIAACRAYAEGIDRQQLGPEIERLAQVAQHQEELADFYEKIAESSFPGDADGLLSLRRAAHLRAQQGEIERAIGLWRDVLNESPNDREALDALARLLEGGVASAEELAEIYQRQAASETESEKRIELLFRVFQAKNELGNEQEIISIARELITLSPKQQDILEMLNNVLSRLGKNQERADVLRLLSETSDDNQYRHELGLERAAILEKEGQVELAVAAYGAILEQAPQESLAVAGLERLILLPEGRSQAAAILESEYRSRNEESRLVDILDIRASYLQPPERIAVLREIARIRYSQGEKSLALAALIGCFHDDPGSEACRNELERLASETGEYAQLAAAYEDELERNHHPEIRQILWRQLGSLYADCLGDLKRAASAWEEALLLAPPEESILVNLAQAYRRLSNKPQLEVIIRQQIQLTGDQERKRELWAELGWLLEDELSQPANAILAWQEVLRHDENNAQAIEKLSRLYSELGQWQDLSVLLGARITETEASHQQEESLDLRVQLGRLRFHHLEDPQGAFTLFKDVLAKRPGHGGALMGLEEMAKKENALKKEAAMALEPIFAQGGDYASLVNVLKEQAECAQGQEKAAILRKIAVVYGERLASADMAFVYASRALESAPDELESLEMALQYAHLASTEQDLAELLESVVDRASSFDVRVILQRTLARLFIGSKDPDSELCIGAYRKLLEMAPCDPEAVEKLSFLWSQKGQWSQALEMVRLQLASCQDADQRLVLLKRLGELQYEKLNDRHGAMVTYRRILEVDEYDYDALQRLDVLCEVEERWVELADVLAKEIALFAKDGRTQEEMECKTRLAFVREERLLDRSGAISLYGEILQQQPQHPEIIPRLENMVSRNLVSEEAIELLHQAYYAAGDFGKLCAMLEERSAQTAEVHLRKKYFLELARIREQHLQRPELAFLDLCKAFREDPCDRELRAILEKTAEQAESEEELAGFYEEELPRLDGVDAAEVCYKLGHLYELPGLHDSERAIGFYEKSRVFDPSNSKKILHALDRLYKESQNWSQLLEVLSDLVNFAEDVNEKTSLLFRLGQMAEEKCSPPMLDRAARAYEHIIELDSNYIPALRALERLWENAQRYEQLFTVLEMQRNVLSGLEKEHLLLRMANIADQKLHNSALAMKLYQEVIAENPRSEAAHTALENLLENSQQNEQFAKFLQKRLSVTVDPREIVRLTEKLGRVFLALNRHQEAIGAFQAALERDPRHKRALDSLRALYEQYSPSDELVSILRRLIMLQDNAESAKKIRLRLAQVLAALGRREEAIEAARRVLDIEPHIYDELVTVEELFRKLGSAADLLRAMEPRWELCRKSGDIAGAISVLYAMVDVQVSLGRRELSAPILERILEMAPGEQMAFGLLREIYSSQSDWRRYESTCERFLPNIQDSQEKVEILRDLAQVREKKLGNKELSFLSYCRAFSEDPTNELIQEEILRLAEETGSYEELAEVLENIIDSLEKGELSARLLLLLAKIQDGKLDEPEIAEATLRNVLEFDPANRMALEALTNMFAKRGLDRDYVQSLEQMCEVARTIEERKAILKEIAQIHDARLNEPGDAIATLQRILELEPDRETFRTLVDLAKREKNWSLAVEVLVRAREFETDHQKRSEYQIEVAEIYEREIQDEEAAVASYRIALDFCPESPNAFSALERIYTKLDRLAELLAVYEARLRYADTAERIRILFSAATIWEDRYQNFENADLSLESLLNIDPSNLQAIKRLERLRKLDAEVKRPQYNRWEDYLRVIEQHLRLKPSLPEQVELLVESGRVCDRELRAADRAVQLFHQALELDPQSCKAVHELGWLYERSGNWPIALEMLRREADLLGSTKEAVEILHRIGRIHEEVLGELDSAVNFYKRALEINPGYLPSIQRLKKIMEACKDWDNYLHMLIQEANYTLEIEERAVAWLAVARFYQESKEDPESAKKYYQEVLKVVPDSIEAAQPLAEICVSSGEWVAAEKMLDIIIQKQSEAIKKDSALSFELSRQLYRLGYVCEKLKKLERALGAYERAYQLDSTYLPSAEGYGNLLVASNRYSEALTIYQAIIIHHCKDLTDLEVVEYYWQVGDLFRKLSSAERAQKEFDKALAIDSCHEPSLRAQMEICELLGQWEKAYEWRARLVSMVDDSSRFELLVGLQKVAKENLGDSFRAIDAGVEALKIRPDAIEVLRNLLVLYQETRQANKAVECLEKILKLPTVLADQNKAKTLWCLLGETYQNNLRDISRAVDAFNNALDIDYTCKGAFQAIESMLVSTKQWGELEKNLIRMIQRIPKTEKTLSARMALWKILGDFYVRVKKDHHAAKTALQIVLKGQPEDGVTLEKYAELVTQELGKEEEAIAAWRNVLLFSSNPRKAVQNLVALFSRTKNYDAAYVSAQVSAHLIGEAGPDEIVVLSKLQPYVRRIEETGVVFTERMWDLVYHFKVRKAMAEILALLYEKLGNQWAKKNALATVEIKSDRIDIKSSLETAVQSFARVSKMLDVESTQLYSPYLAAVRARRKRKISSGTIPDAESLLEVLHTHPVSIKAGGKLFGEERQKDLLFILARALTFCRPEFALAKMMPADRLEAVFQAAVLLGAPNFKATAAPSAIELEKRALLRLEPQFLTALKTLGRQYAPTATSSDVRDFLEGAEHTADRLGVLMCSDLEIVRQAFDEKLAFSNLPFRARLRDLMLFCISPQYAELRKALGLTIEVQLETGT